MKVEKTSLPGVQIIEPDVFGDQRGFFMESWNQARYADQGIDIGFVQSNVSRSNYGVLRGLHFQNPNPQGKLVFVLEGSVFDVAVDIRQGSPNFGDWFGYELSAENNSQLYIPPGFAHGFCVTSQSALFCYFCSAPYDKDSDRAVRWDDASIGIEWPVSDPRLSDKDAVALHLSEHPNLPQYA